MYSFSRSTLSAGLVLTALSLSTMSFAQTLRESVTFTNLTSDGAAGAATNGSGTYVASGGYQLGSIRVSGTFTPTGAGTYASEARVRYTQPDGSIYTQGGGFPGFPGSTTTLNTPYTVTNFAVSAANFSTATQANPAGSWLFNTFESFNDPGVDGAWSNIKFDFYDFAPPTPPTSTNLGTLNFNSLSSANTSLTSGGVNWFSFTLASPASLDRFLDISTVNVGGAIDDTEIGLYSASGALIASDDDDSLDGTYSALSFGSSTAYDGRVTQGGAFGRDGATLAAGTYYLAVGEYNTTFDSGFSVTSSGTGTGAVQLRFHAAPAPSSVAVMALGGLMPMVAIARRRRTAK